MKVILSLALLLLLVLPAKADPLQTYVNSDNYPQMSEKELDDKVNMYAAYALVGLLGNPKTKTGDVPRLVVQARYFGIMMAAGEMQIKKEAKDIIDGNTESKQSSWNH